MGNFLGTVFSKILGTVFPKGRLVRFHDSTGSRRLMAFATGLQQFRRIARKKLGFEEKDEISIYETSRGCEISDEDVFLHLDSLNMLIVINVTKGQTWTRPPELPWLFVWHLLHLFYSHPPTTQSPYHQVASVASGSYTAVTRNQAVYSIQAQQVQVGDNNQALYAIFLNFCRSLYRSVYSFDLYLDP